MSGSLGSSSVKDTFAHNAAKLQAVKKRACPPFSLRLTPEERKCLDELAGNRPLGAYIRERLLGEHAQHRNFTRRPKVDQQQVALVLAELGNSRLSSNVNQLAKASNMGTLDVSEDVEQQLQDACAAIIAMRSCLMIALGLKSDGNKP